MGGPSRRATRTGSHRRAADGGCHSAVVPLSLRSVNDGVWPWRAPRTALKRGTGSFLGDAVTRGSGGGRQRARDRMDWGVWWPCAEHCWLTSADPRVPRPAQTDSSAPYGYHSEARSEPRSPPPPRRDSGGLRQAQAHAVVARAGGAPTVAPAPLRAGRRGNQPTLSSSSIPRAWQRSVVQQHRSRGPRPHHPAAAAPAAASVGDTPRLRRRM